uniref:RING-type domain-containing protein n=1 Tax=Ascaris lumbricoides TaxID=6252 RepID=A0A0M3IMU7_ASCLU
MKSDAMENQLITEDPQEHLILDSEEEQLYPKISDGELSADVQDNDLCMTSPEDQFSAFTSSDSGQNARISEDTISNNIEQTQLSTSKPEEQLEVASERDGCLGNAHESEELRDDECDKKQEGRNLAAGDSNIALDIEEGHREGSDVGKLYASGIEIQSPAPVVIEYSQDIQLSTVSSDGNQPPEESRSPDSMSFVQNRRTDPLDEFLNGSWLRSGCLRDEMDPQSGGGKLPRSFSDLGCFNWSAHVNVTESSLVNDLVQSDLNGSCTGYENAGNAVEQPATNYSSMRGDPMTNVQEIFLPENCLRQFSFSPMASVHTLYRRLAGSCRVVSEKSSRRGYEREFVMRYVMYIIIVGIFLIMPIYHRWRLGCLLVEGKFIDGTDSDMEEASEEACERSMKKAKLGLLTVSIAVCVVINLCSIFLSAYLLAIVLTEAKDETAIAEEKTHQVMDAILSCLIPTKIVDQIKADSNVH